MKKPWRWSLSARLVIFFVAATLALTVISAFLLLKAKSHHFQERIHPFLNQHLNYITAEIGIPPNTAVAKNIAQRLPMVIYIVAEDFFWSSDGTRIDSKHFIQRPPRFAMPEHRKLHRHSVPGLLDGQFTIRRRTQGYDFYFVMEPGRFGGPGVFGQLLLISVVLVGAVTYLHTRWLFKPIQAIGSGVMRISQGILDQPIGVKRSDELGDLAGKVNDMAAQIQSMLDAKRQLLLAISHELRSPLSRINVNLATIEEPGRKDAIVEDVREMDHLIAELLEIERLNSRHSVLNLQTISINATIRQVVESQGWDNEILVQLDASRNLRLRADDSRIRLMVKNLAENALTYNRPECGKVTLITKQTNGNLVLDIRDHGSGVAKQHLAHLTDAFYRVDPARQRETGGYGLGLYLCRLVAEAHHGSLLIESETGKYTQVRVTLPVTTGD